MFTLFREIPQPTDTVKASMAKPNDVKTIVNMFIEININAQLFFRKHNKMYSDEHNHISL